VKPAGISRKFIAPTVVAVAVAVGLAVAAGVWGDDAVAVGVGPKLGNVGSGVELHPASETVAATAATMYARASRPMGFPCLTLTRHLTNAHDPNRPPEIALARSSLRAHARFRPRDSARTVIFAGLTACDPRR
jgi:hypothetical protein